MSRYAVLVLLLVLVGTPLVVADHIMPAEAQESASVGSGFVGSWRLTVGGWPGGASVPTLATFMADGNLVTAARPVQPAPPGSPITRIFVSGGHGAWVATGERTVDITFVVLQTDENGNFLGTATIRGSSELGSDGQTFAGVGTATVADPTGTVLGSFPVSPLATRIEVEPMVPLGTPPA